jgi:alkylation response protein AidB-like acyl-CoA dehydrogenase
MQVACTDGTLAGVDGLSRRAIGGLDPALGLVEVTGTAVTGTAATTSTQAVAWDAAVAAGQRAIAHELVGAAAAMLDLARDHAVVRVQFGVPIASFQAVRHRLADSLVAVESARGALEGAWEAGAALDAAVAKAIAGRSARLVARHAQQVLAGIGFTMEHPLHRYVRRVLVLDGLLGDARSLTCELGQRVLRDRGLPAVLPL